MRPYGQTPETEDDFNCGLSNFTKNPFSVQQNEFIGNMIGHGHIQGLTLFMVAYDSRKDTEYETT